MLMKKITNAMMAHVARRLFHICSIIFVPFVYYTWIKKSFDDPFISIYIVLGVCFFAIAFEMARIHYGWMFFGQRAYEKERFSAFAWTVVALGVLLIVSPSENITMPIAISCALADPLAGELRLRNFNPKIVFVLPVLVVFFTWFFYGYVWWISLLMAVVTIAAERPVLKWVDDNALMMLASFLFYWVLYVLCLV